MAEQESAHGKLTPIDQKLTNTVFLGVLVATLTAALIIIFVIASHPLTERDFGWSPFAHDFEQHTLEHSTF